MKCGYLLLIVIVGGAFPLPVAAAGKTQSCEELKKSIDRTAYGIKTSEDMVKSDPSLDTPDMRKALADMKAKLAEKQAERKAKGCEEGESQDLMDMTHDQKFKNPCDKARAEVTATQEYVATLDKELAGPNGPGDVERLKKAKALSLKHIQKEREIQKAGCK